jgi:hypothetical protein
MGYREVSVVEIREVLRRWVRGEGFRSIDRNTGVDRKTVRRYVEAAQAVGMVANGDESQLNDGVIGLVCLAVRPERPRGHGAAWERLVPHTELIKGWVGDDLTAVKIHILLGRGGIVVPYRTLHRFAVANAGYGRRQPTVRPVRSATSYRAHLFLFPTNLARPQMFDSSAGTSAGGSAAPPSPVCSGQSTPIV